MHGIDGVWGVFANIQASIIFGFVALICMFRHIVSDNDNPGTRPQRAAAIFALCASFYTFFLLVISQIFGGPVISELIELGFGNERVAWLLLAVVTEQCVRLLDMIKSKSR